jgi:hypothetical protein
MSTNNLAQDLLRNMTDRQLQEVLSAISTAANQASQTTQSQPAVTPQRKAGNVQGTNSPFEYSRELMFV